MEKGVCSRLILLAVVLFTDSSSVYGLRKVYSQKELRENVECPEPTGQFPHPRHCDRYLNCWKGEMAVQKCPGSLVFNENVKACDWPGNVDCSSRNPDGTNPPPSRPVEPQQQQPPTTTTTTTTTSKPYYPSSKPLRPKPPVGSTTTATTATTRPTTTTTTRRPPLRPKPTPPYQPPNPSEGQNAEPISTTKRPSVAQGLKPKPQYRPTSERPTESPAPPPPPPFNPSFPEFEEEGPSSPGNNNEIYPPEAPVSELPPPPAQSSSSPRPPSSFPSLKPPPPPSDSDPGFFPFPHWPTVKCPISHGFLPVTGQCDAVVACFNGIGHLLRCPPGHRFDGAAGSCVPTRGAEECRSSVFKQKEQSMLNGNDGINGVSSDGFPAMQFVYVPQAILPFFTQEMMGY